MAEPWSSSGAALTGRRVRECTVCQASNLQGSGSYASSCHTPRPYYTKLSSPTYQLHPTVFLRKEKEASTSPFWGSDYTSLDLGGRNKGLRVGRRQKWLTGAHDMGGRQCEMGIGQLDSAPVANRPGFWAPTTDKKSTRSQTVCHSRSTSPADLSIHSFGLQSVLDRRMLVLTLLPVYLISGPHNAPMPPSEPIPLRPRAFSPLAHVQANLMPGTPHDQAALKRHSRWRPLERHDRQKKDDLLRRRGPVSQ
ncbi:hypothetical protein CI102_11092 [Trichoderma harzianum]|nr:hypothetical protein CI102_11092 [Trichoderma harzianum]